MSWASSTSETWSLSGFLVSRLLDLMATSSVVFGAGVGLVVLELMSGLLNNLRLEAGLGWISVDCCCCSLAFTFGLSLLTFWGWETFWLVWTLDRFFSSMLENSLAAFDWALPVVGGATDGIESNFCRVLTMSCCWLCEGSCCSGELKLELAAGWRFALLVSSCCLEFCRACSGKFRLGK